MSVRLLTREDVEDAKNPGVKRKERFSFYGKTTFQGDSGRGALYLTKKHKKQDAGDEGREGGIRITAFHALPEADRNVFIVTTFKELIKKLSRPRVCVACNKNFDFATELGRRSCAWHPGKVTAGEVWSCCGKDWDPEEERKQRKNGCCMTDHNSRRNDPSSPAFVVLPLLLAIYLGVPRSAIPAAEWKDKPSPMDVCTVQITTSIRFAEGQFVYAAAPTKRELIERPQQYRYTLVKRSALPLENALGL